ncbi:transposase (plasmid) [Azospirillum sp. B510]|nr:transposase [Azospirillum sp. B510]
MIRQELAREKGIAVSLRTVERAVAPLRRELVAQARATVRFETRPGEQMEIDFGVRRIEIGGVATVVFLFVATLGYSRRLHVRAYGHEKQDSWFDGLESAFRAFGGVPRRFCSTTRGRWSYTPSPGTGASGYGPAPRTGRAPGGLDAGHRRSALSRHDRRSADRAVPAGGGRGAETAGRHPALHHGARPGSPGRHGLRGGGGAGAAAPAGRIRGRGWGRLLMSEHDHLIAMLNRLKLTALRDQLDSLIDEAGRRELTIRESLALFCEREIARRDQRCIDMGFGLARFPFVRELAGFDFAAQPSLDKAQIREIASGRFIADGFSPRSVLMGASDGRVDEQVLAVRIVGHCFKEAFPHAFPAPSAEAAEDTVPFAEYLRKIKPRRTGAHNPKKCFDEHPVIPTRCAPRSFISNDVRGYSSPLIVPKNQPIQYTQVCLSESSLELHLRPCEKHKSPHDLGGDRHPFQGEAVDEIVAGHRIRQIPVKAGPPLGRDHHRVAPPLNETYGFGLHEEFAHMRARYTETVPHADERDLRPGFIAMLQPKLHKLCQDHHASLTREEIRDRRVGCDELLRMRKKGEPDLARGALEGGIALEDPAIAGHRKHGLQRPVIDVQCLPVMGQHGFGRS